MTDRENVVYEAIERAVTSGELLASDHYNGRGIEAVRMTLDRLIDDATAARWTIEASLVKDVG